MADACPRINVRTSNDVTVECNANGGNSNGLFDGQDQALISLNYNMPHNEGLINIDFTILNIPLLLKDLDAVMAIVKELYESYLQWLYKLEYEFLIRTETGEIAMDLRLFNRIAGVIPRMRRAHKLLRTWYADFLNCCNKLSDLLLQYQKICIQLKSLDATTSEGGTGIMQPNVIALAKANLSRSKAIQRARTRIMTLDSKIRAAMQEISFLIRDLKSGILRINQDNDRVVFNLNEITEALTDLSQTNSPLVQIYEKLATIINKTPIVSVLHSDAPRRLNVDETPHQFLSEMSSNTISAADLVKRLSDLLLRKMYTTTSAKSIETIEDFIHKTFRDAPEYQNLMDGITALRKNVPRKVLTDLRILASNPENILTTIQRINSLLDNLDAEDEIYRNQLLDVKKSATETAKRDLETTSNASTMNVETTNLNVPSNSALLGIYTPPPTTPSTRAEVASGSGASSMPSTLPINEDNSSVDVEMSDASTSRYRGDDNTQNSVLDTDTVQF